MKPTPTPAHTTLSCSSFPDSNTLLTAPSSLRACCSRKTRVVDTHLREVSDTGGVIFNFSYFQTSAWVCIGSKCISMALRFFVDEQTHVSPRSLTSLSACRTHTGEKADTFCRPAPATKQFYHILGSQASPPFPASATRILRRDHRPSFWACSRNRVNLFFLSPNPRKHGIRGIHRAV